MIQSHEQRTCKSCGLTGPLAWFPEVFKRGKRHGAVWHRHVCHGCRNKELALLAEKRAAAREARGVTPLTDEAPERTCIKCEAVKPTAEFSLMDKGARRGNECAACRRAYQKQYRKENLTRMQEYHAMRKAADPDYYRAQQLRSKFKISIAEFDAMLAAQGGVCASCGTDDPGKKVWAVDHDHSCCPGRRSCGDCIRGLICTKCNLILGQVNDDPAVLQSMIDYLAASKRPKLRAI